MKHDENPTPWTELRDDTASCFIMAALVFAPMVAPAYLEELNAARDFIITLWWF